ncbi:MAG: UDP-3-O-(3-hydroxymyristoyl)glucosamine N-acyltransferase [Rhizomicrobium sp.]
MIDRRFFHRSGPFSLGYVAERVSGQLSHPAAADAMAHDIAAPECAGRSDLSIFSDTRYQDACARSSALAVVTTHQLAELLPDEQNILFVSQPRLASAQISQLFYPHAPLEAHIHASAKIDPTAVIGAGSQIDGGAVIGGNVTVGARCHIGAGAVLDHGVTIGDDCCIGATTTISHAKIGSRVRIKTGVSIGGEGFGFVPSPTGLLRMSQLGCVVIEDDVEIGGNCAVDRGSLGDTVIGSGTKIDNLVQVAHNVHIGKNCVIAGQAGVAGSTTIGDEVMIGGQVAVGDHLTIGSRAKIAGKSGVMRDIAAGETVGGYPAVPIRLWHRQTVALLQLLNRKPKAER